MTQYKANFENFEPKFETAYSHLEMAEMLSLTQSYSIKNLSLLVSLVSNSIQ